MESKQSNTVGRKPLESFLFAGSTREQKTLLKTLMNGAGIKQKDVADMLGIHESVVSGFVARQRNNSQCIKFFEHLHKEQGIQIIYKDKN